MNTDKSGFQVHRTDNAPKYSSYAQRRMLQHTPPSSTDATPTKLRSRGVPGRGSNLKTRVDSPPSITSSAPPSPDLPYSRSSIYDAIVVTRLDLLSLVYFHSSLGVLLQSTYLEGSGSMHRKVGRKRSTSKWEHTIVAGGNGNRRYALFPYFCNIALVS